MRSPWLHEASPRQHARMRSPWLRRAADAAARSLVASAASQAGGVCGVEALAMLDGIVADGADARKGAYLPRLHTATIAERTVVLVLPHAMLRPPRNALALELEALGGRRYACGGSKACAAVRAGGRDCPRA